MEIGETLYVTNQEDFRQWLEENHSAKKEIWLIQYKKATKKPSINYVEVVKYAPVSADQHRTVDANNAHTILRAAEIELDHETNKERDED
jgi:uncharacterized protein YdeI (YjbR/CyaY-like superfamily)